MIPTERAQDPHESGLYWLLVKLLRPARPVVGALGRTFLAPGVYIYTGSARRNLGHRVARHLRRSKPIRWHIDYLTTHRAARPMGAVILTHHPRSALPLEECDLNRIAGSLPGACAPILRFGSSDCRAGCPAHLWRLGGGGGMDATGPHGMIAPITLDDVAERLASIIPLGDHAIHVVRPHRQAASRADPHTVIR